MQSTVVTELESLSRWRAEVDRRLLTIERFLREHELDGEADIARLAMLRDRLAAEHITVAFVAEFSRGKSELINAIFFADAGRRIMPATPGRTTMCPVELHHDPAAPASLALLPIETRLQGLSLAELRRRHDVWQHVPLDPDDPAALAHALAAVTRTQPVSEQRAADLGFWHEGDDENNPPRADDGGLEVPAWRHAVINYPHPLLSRGLVVIDTPGLNAIGAEPELTLGLLPSAHATVFLLAADTGVTRSDLSVWREHLSGSSLERFVVLNKIDTLIDPLSSAAQIEEQIDQQRQATARTLELPPQRVFPLSARDALAARVAGDDEQLQRSRLPELEAALARELMPRQREMLAGATTEVLDTVGRSVRRHLGDRRRQCTEQLLELRGLRGKSGTKLRVMRNRLESESAEFESCTVRLAALRAVHSRMLGVVLSSLSSDTLRTEVAAMQAALSARPLNLGARPSFATLCGRLRAILANVAAQTDEMRQMLEASIQRLNADFGFAFSVPRTPSLVRFRSEIERIETSYGQYLSVTQAWRMAAPGFREQFRRMLLSKLRVVFENAAADVELWSKAISGPMEQQLRERRQAFARRRESLERVQDAAGELEARIGEVEAQEQRLQARLEQFECLMREAWSEVQRGAMSAGEQPLPVRDAA